MSDDEERECKTCFAFLPITSFPKMGNYHSRECRQCFNLRQKARYRNTRAVGRKRTKLELNSELCNRVQGAIDEGKALADISVECKISLPTITSAVVKGVLKMRAPGN